MSYPGHPGGEQPPQYAYPDNPGVGGYPPVPPQPVPHQESPTYAPGAAPMPTYPPPDQYQPQYGYGEPSSGPPMPGPVSGPTMSMPPISGAPVQPISGPPPYGMAPPPPGGPVAPRRGPLVPILAGVAVLLLVAAGVMTGLYVNKNNALASANSTIKTRNATISDREKELKQVKSDLEAKSTALDKAQQDLRGTQNESDKNKHDKQVVANCLQLLLEALNAANANDKATFDKKINDMKTPCAEAQVIMKT